LSLADEETIEQTFQIVGQDEADVSEAASVTSPLARAL